MASRAMKVKVIVSDLIEKVEAAKKAAVARYEKDLAAWEKQNEQFQDKVLAALASAHVAAVEGKLPRVGNEHINRSWQDCLYVPVKGRPDSKPTLNVAQFDRDLGILRMAADETLSISTDDGFARYL